MLNVLIFAPAAAGPGFLAAIRIRAASVNFGFTYLIEKSEKRWK